VGPKPEHDCFADEVAIDFPSMKPMVARVRRSLADAAGEPHEVVRTEVWVSSDEANRGAIVPVTVLLRTACATCGGRGETWAEACEACEGSGDQLVPRRLHVRVPPRVNDGSSLQFRLRSQFDASVQVEVRVGRFKHDRWR
jgi:hypothetical protein